MCEYYFIIYFIHFKKNYHNFFLISYKTNNIKKYIKKLNETNKFISQLRINISSRKGIYKKN